MERFKLNFRFLASLAMLVLLMHLTALSSDQNKNSISFNYSLRTNLSAPMPPPYLKKEDTGYYDYTGRKNIIYHGMDLIGNFDIINLTSDTLKLSPNGLPFYTHVNLEYAYPGNENRALSIRILSKPISTDSIPESNANTLFNRNILTPKGKQVIEVKCAWEELSKIDADTVKFRFVFDNSEDLKRDGSILAIKYKTEFLNFKLIPLKTKLDSINYFDMSVQNMYSKGKLQDAVDLCRQMLQMDSTLFNPYYLTALGFWRMNQFEKAIDWAKKAIAVIYWQKQVKEFYITSDQGQYVDLLNRIIDKCRRHETWEPHSLITE